MINLTNKNIEFLSNRELVKILKSVLEEIDIVASAGAHRATTYLAVSAIEGLCDELLRLLKIEKPEDLPPGMWPTDDKGKNKKRSKFNFADMLKALDGAGALPKNFEKLYDEPLRIYRNFMHPDREYRELVLEANLTPIAQSVGQLALAGLNALIEKYEDFRFATVPKLQLEYGLAEVLDNGAIQMPQNPGEFVSLLVSELPAQHFREITFQVIIPPNAIFNFIYNFFSLDRFMAARIEGREQNGRGLDNGRLHCAKWRVWHIDRHYKSEPDPKLQKHTVKIVLDPPGTFALTVDQNQLELADDADWEFNPQGKLGFMTEWGLVSIIDLQVQPR